MLVQKSVNPTGFPVRHSTDHTKPDAAIHMGDSKGIMNERREGTAGPQRPHSRWHTEETTFVICSKIRHS